MAAMAHHFPKNGMEKTLKMLPLMWSKKTSSGRQSTHIQQQNGMVCSCFYSYFFILNLCHAIQPYILTAPHLQPPSWGRVLTRHIFPELNAQILRQVGKNATVSKQRDKTHQTGDIVATIVGYDLMLIYFCLKMRNWYTQIIPNLRPR